LDLGTRGFIFLGLTISCGKISTHDCYYDLTVLKQWENIGNVKEDIKETSCGLRILGEQRRKHP
jgi:hypothetical protein